MSQLAGQKEQRLDRQKEGCGSGALAAPLAVTMKFRIAKAKVVSTFELLMWGNKRAPCCMGRAMECCDSDRREGRGSASDDESLGHWLLHLVAGLVGQRFLRLGQHRAAAPSGLPHRGTR